MAVLSVEEDLDVRGVVVDDVVGVEIGPGALGEDPSVLILGDNVFGFGLYLALDKQILVVEHHLFDLAVLHE